MGMFPLSTVLFPDGALPLHVFEPRYLALVRDCLAGGAGGGVASVLGAGRDVWTPVDRSFGVVLISRGSEVGGGDERFDLGTVARIERMAEAGEGRRYVLAHGLERIQVVAWLDDDPYPRAEVEPRPSVTAVGDMTALSAATKAVRRLRSLLSEWGDMPALPFELPLARLADTASFQLCELAPLSPLDRQNLLSIDAVSDRLALLVELCEATARDVATLLAEGNGDAD
jgi:uncharacterized protein